MASCILSASLRSVHVSPSSLVRLQHAARECSVSTSSVRRACNEGFIPVSVLASGHRRVKIADCKAHFLGIQPEDTGRETSGDAGKVVAVYARVSSDHQKADLVTQTAELERQAQERFPGQTVRVFSEIGSGANSDRPAFNRLIDAMLAGEPIDGL